MIATASYIFGIVFIFGNGYYFVDIFDIFGASFPLLLIALCELLGVLFYSTPLGNDWSFKELPTAGIKTCAEYLDKNVSLDELLTYNKSSV